MRRSLIMRSGGPRSETTQFMSEVDRFLTGKSPKSLHPTQVLNVREGGWWNSESHSVSVHE